MKKTLLSLFAFALILSANAQRPTIQNSSSSNIPEAPAVRNCGAVEYEKMMKEKFPQMETVEDFEKWLAPKVKEYEQMIAGSNAKKVVYTIPVIVHVIHNSNENVGSGRNISQAQVYSQFDVLNEDFRRTNTDASQTPSTFVSVAADCEINFCKALRDPNGTPLVEPGIHRVSATSISGLSNTTSGYSMNTCDNTIKPATSWDPTKYMNIWVCQLSGGLLGYAQFPNSSGLSGINNNNGAANTDGVVIGYNYFGRVGTLSAPFNKGRTATHEIGHWLGLRHINGDSNCGTDYCNDTPTQQYLSSGCPTHPRTTCSSADQFMNYMDYTNDACMNMFSLNQKARMVTVMQNSPRRSTLNASTVCNPANLDAEFSANVTTINAGQSVTFTDQSTGPNPITTWSWNFSTGGTPSTANTQGPHVVTYNTPGTYTVSLTVGDGTSTNTETKTSYILVNPVGTVTCDSVGNWLLNPDGGNSQTGVYTWGAGNGYVMGRNAYDDNGWADKVTFSQSGKELKEVIYFFGAAKGTGNIRLKVWGQATGGEPNNSNVMASSTIGISTITPAQGKVWTLSPRPALNGNFFVGFDHPTTGGTGDTVALFSTPKTTATMWAYESTPAWTALSTYSVNHSAAIIPIACNIITGEEEALVEVPEIKVFPNPSNGEVKILMPKSNMSEIYVLNMLGEIVYNYSGFQKNYLTIDLKDRPNGVYFVKVKIGEQVSTQKIVLTK